MTNIDDQTMTIVYGLGDFVRSVTRFDGSTVTHGYDHAGRRTSTAFAQGQDEHTVTTTWTPNSLIESITDGTTTLNYDYDSLSRLIEAAQSGTGILPVQSSYAHDPVGNMTDTTVRIGEGQGQITLSRGYAWDAADRLEELEAESGTFAFNYRADNGLVASVASVDSGINASYDFDVMDRLTDIAWENDNPQVMRSFAMTYARDENENDLGTDMIEKIVREDDSYRVYAYDSLDRRTGEQHFDDTDTLLYSASYTYDLAGNRTETTINGVTHTYTLAQTGDRLASWGVNGENTLTYDSAGNVTQRVVDGRPTLDLSWDLEYRLTEVSSGGNPVESYQYDPTGRRIKTVNTGGTTWHVYDGAHVIADVDDQGELIRSYTWGPGIDNLLALTVHDGQTSETYYAITDHLGTVLALVDDNGSIAESYRYDVFGNVLGVYDANGQPLPSSGIGNRYLFQGREYSWAIHTLSNGGAGLYNFRARWYDPLTGRWLSNDPIGISGGLNQYVAFGNNPVMFVDPWGLAFGVGEALVVVTVISLSVFAVREARRHREIRSIPSRVSFGDRDFGAELWEATLGTSRAAIDAAAPSPSVGMVLRQALERSEDAAVAGHHRGRDEYLSTADYLRARDLDEECPRRRRRRP